MSETKASIGAMFCEANGWPRFAAAIRAGCNDQRRLSKLLSIDVGMSLVVAARQSRLAGEPGNRNLIHVSIPRHRRDAIASARGED